MITGKTDVFQQLDLSVVAQGDSYEACAAGFLDSSQWIFQWDPSAPELLPLKKNIC